MNYLKEMTEITLDLSCRHAPVQLYAKQGDIDSRSIRAHFLFGGRKFDLSQAERSEIRVRKPDGTITVNEGEIAEDVAVYPLTEQSLAAAGEAQADFLLYGGGGEVISCIPARLTVIPAPSGDEAVVSTNEYTAFREQVEDIDNRLADFRSTYASQMSQMYGKLSELTQRLGAASIKICTAEEYSALTPDPNTVYYVADGSKVTQYLGDVKLTSGTVSAGSATVMADGTAQAVSGAAQTMEEE